MDKRLFASRPLISLVILAMLVTTAVIGYLLFFPSSQQTSECAGLCQACYCENFKLINGVNTCIVNGAPSACVGCVGACAGLDNCLASPGQGGCGAYIVWQRDSDCGPTPRPPTPTARPTPTPTPPPQCRPRTWVEVTKPGADIKHEPPYPLVARQDTTNTGFTLEIIAHAGYAEKREQEPEQMCRHGGAYPEDCRNDWQWVCVRRTLERYDDPMVDIDLDMDLGEGVREWIENDLGSRYYGAHVQEDFPKAWRLYRGPGLMTWTHDFEYHPYDPGTHTVALQITTMGTPLSEPQHVTIPYDVPVYLWDTSYDLAGLP